MRFWMSWLCAAKAGYLSLGHLAPQMQLRGFRHLHASHLTLLPLAHLYMPLGGMPPQHQFDLLKWLVGLIFQFCTNHED